MRIADFDFETYSSAGFVWNEQKQKYFALPGCDKKGLPAVGIVAYSEHPDTEVLSMAYNLKDGKGERLWTLGDAPPIDLFTHLRSGELLEAWNVAFEYWIWTNVCVKKYLWPPLPVKQLRCAMAKSRAYGLPGGLGAAAEVLKTDIQKDKEGKRLLNKFSIPRDPTKNNRKQRILLSDEPEEAKKLFDYNLKDIATESAISDQVPDLSPTELEFWQCDQAINRRGVQIDVALVKASIEVIEVTYERYNKELFLITGGAVEKASQVARLLKWLNIQGCDLPNLNSETVENFLKNNKKYEGDELRRAIEIRYTIASAAVKKFYTILRQVSQSGRLHELFVYHSARTGRAAGAGAQPQNLPNSTMDIAKCACEKYFAKGLSNCPWCDADQAFSSQVPCNMDVIESIIESILTKNSDLISHHWGNPVDAIYACLRSAFIAAPNHSLICSDYKAIEAVVLAVLAGENWRIEVFKTHGKIYETSAARIAGTTLQELLDYEQEHGHSHPLRKVGKVAELASGYQGWIGAWKNFGADSFMLEEEIKKAIMAWREASPMIVQMWNWLNNVAISAIENPEVIFDYRLVRYVYVDNILYCILPSGRRLTYHNAKIEMGDRGKYISFCGWNTNPKNGAVGWIRMSTYGGKLTENIVQAVARDILSHAIVNLERAGIPVVLHIHDEIVCEVPQDKAEVLLMSLENIMSTMPAWAADWPIKASGGWVGKRYRK
jgi:DNA polymerase bacteriophage-type